MAMNQPGPDDAALAALHALDGVDGAEPDPSVEAKALDYADAIAALAEAVASRPSLGLRGRVLAAAFAGRVAGESIDDGGADAAPVVFARTVADIAALLAELDELDWLEPAHPQIGRVRDVVAHLLAIELYVLEQLLSADGGTAPERETLPHLDYTRELVESVADVPVDELRHRWRQAADALLAAAEHADPSAVVVLHTLPVHVEGALFLRSFELWAHLDDMSRAVGRRRPRLDARRLRAMSRALVEALPLAMSMIGDDVRGSVHLVVTGPGGGDYAVHLRPSGPADGGTRADATVIVDVVDLCRLAARRASVERIAVRVEGDEALAAALLAAAPAFAMD